jgi:hypothetical protein
MRNFTSAFDICIAEVAERYIMGRLSPADAQDLGITA